MSLVCLNVVLQSNQIEIGVHTNTLLMFYIFLFKRISPVITAYATIKI